MVASVEWGGTDIVLLSILILWTRGVGHRITAQVIMLLMIDAVTKVLLTTVAIGTAAPQAAGTMAPIAVVIARGAALLHVAETETLPIATMMTVVMVATTHIVWSSTVDAFSLLTMVMAKLVTAAMSPVTVEQCMALVTAA